MNANLFPVSKTLNHVLIAVLLLTAFVVLAPARSEAAVRTHRRVSVQVGKSRCCQRQYKVWVPGRYVTKVGGHGRSMAVWVPGHWIRA